VKEQIIYVGEENNIWYKDGKKCRLQTDYSTAIRFYFN